jgi:hypothetical protein
MAEPATRSRTGYVMLGFVAIAVLVVILLRSLWASSPDAWDAFRTGLSEACATASALPDARVEIDAIGTARYGVALVTGTRAGDEAPVTLVCVVTKSPAGLVDVEVTGPIGEFVE